MCGSTWIPADNPILGNGSVDGPHEVVEGDDSIAEVGFKVTMLE
jgi:hypothetical protein